MKPPHSLAALGALQSLTAIIGISLLINGCAKPTTLTTTQQLELMAACDYVHGVPSLQRLEMWQHERIRAVVCSAKDEEP